MIIFISIPSNTRCPVRLLNSSPRQDDDSDGELFTEEAGAGRHHGAGVTEAPVPSVYRAPNLPNQNANAHGVAPSSRAPAAPEDDAPSAPAYGSGAGGVYGVDGGDPARHGGRGERGPVGHQISRDASAEVGIDPYVHVRCRSCAALQKLKNIIPFET